MMHVGAGSLASSFQKSPVRAPFRCSCRRQTARRGVHIAAAASGGKDVWLLDYGAGNVRSVRNAIKFLGYNVKDVRPPIKEGQSAHDYAAHQRSRCSGETLLRLA